MLRNLKTRHEELEAAITHGLGFVLSVIASSVLLYGASIHTNPLLLILCAVYAITLIMVYVASTMSHMHTFQRINTLLRRCDQGFIYLLIVGSATPFMYFLLSNNSTMITGLGIIILLWTLALVGCISKVVFSYRLNHVDISLYLLLGWGEAITLFIIQSSLTPPILNWMIAGGVLYSIGTVFFILDWSKYHFHTIWHLLVMAGSVTHFYAIVLLVKHINEDGVKMIIHSAMSGFCG